MIRNLGETLTLLKPKLRAYLQKSGTQFKGRLFQCPNRKVHKNQDIKPACNFVDTEETKFYCFVCGTTGDIFNAVNLLENKPITGSGFHDTVEHLCKLLKVPFQAAEDTPESVFLQEVNHFLNTLIKKGHDNLTNLIETDANHPAVKFLLEKGWIQSVDDYRLGVISQLNQTKSQKLTDICNFLNLDVNDLLKGIIIPIEFHQHYIGFQIRAIDNNDPIKYRTYLTTSKGLFNLDKIDPTQPVYVVEGASSVLVFNTFKIPNVVATLGNGFNKDHYESLITREVKDLVIIYDNDDGGNIGRSRVSEVCVDHPEIQISFKLLSGEKDPADYLMSGKKLDDLPTLSLWDYLLFIKNKELLLRYVAAQRDLIQKEQLVNDLTKVLDVTKSVLVEEIQKFEDALSEVPTISSLKEKESLIETINIFEKWAWTRGALLGIKSFECFDKSFDGLQEGLILVGGPPNVGKSALVTSASCQIMDKNPDAYVVYLTIDDSSLVTTARFLANLSGIPINIVSNPKYKIMENKYYTPEERNKLIVAREKALDKMRKTVSLFNMKDASSGYTIEYVNALLKSLEPLLKDKKLVLVIDNLHKLRSEKDYKSDKTLVDNVCSNLKIISGKYRCPVICTVEHTKQAISMGEVGGGAIKETSALQYDANLILTVTLKQLVGTFKLVDVVVSKNKFSTFIGTLPFKLYPDLSKMAEAEGSVAIFGGTNEDPKTPGAEEETKAQEEPS